MPPFSPLNFVFVSVLCLTNWLPFIKAIEVNVGSDGSPVPPPIETIAMRGLLKEAREAELERDLNVAVGFGACLDVTVDAIDFLVALDVIPSHSDHHDMISSEYDLQETFSYFFSQVCNTLIYIVWCVPNSIACV